VDGTDVDQAPVDEAAVEEAVAEELIADAAVGGTPPAAEAPAVHSVGDLTTDDAPEQTELVDDVVPDVAALDYAEDELVDLGGPAAAESVTPGSDVPDSTATAGSGSAEDSGPTSPVEGYDSFSIPALRGHLRAYPTETVADLLDYERATRARAPYVTLLQNRLEKLSIDRG